MSKVNKKGIFALVVSLGVIALLFMSPATFTGERVSQTITTEMISIDDLISTGDLIGADDLINLDGIQNVDGVLSADDLNLQFAIDDLIVQSIINTDVLFRDSDDTFAEQIVDSLGLGEKFGIVTTVSLVDSNNNITTETNVFGVALPTNLSVTDESGNVLDFGGTVQVVFDSVLPSGTVGTSWASVEFYLDDSEIDSTDLWASHIDESRETMILVDELHDKRNDLPTPPSFSERDKDNFTFTFTDENLSDGTHTFRVVITNVDAVAGENTYNYRGENIVYELDFDVDNNKVTKIAEDGNGEIISVYKSDSKLIIESASAQTCAGSGIRHYCHNARSPDMPPIPNVKLTVDGFEVIISSLEPITSAGHDTGCRKVLTQNDGVKSYINICPSTSSTTSADKGITVFFPRNADIQIEINGEVFVDEITPLSQKNYEIKCYPHVTSKQYASFTGSNHPYSYMEKASFSYNCTSSIGYTEHLGTATSTLCPPCGRPSGNTGI